MQNKECENWLENMTEDTKRRVYERAYDYMTYRKAYFGENLTVKDAIERIRSDGLLN